ncbi:GNAT family N-acetyltransferase [Paenibacillus sp. CC-CFT747]|nr:GNAT family N-acetyltransferase [Paenibacillus sp. CC-CFT747]
MMEHPTITFKPLRQCTFDQAAELWNSGFRHYFSDMTHSVDVLARQIGLHRIQPTLSVTAFAEDEPAGFVFIATFETGGRKLAWNGGTGVNPRFRGMGLAKRLMEAATHGVRNAGFDAFLLEVVAKNASAISAYEHVGFRAVDDLIGMKRVGAFEVIPFATTNRPMYESRKGLPIEASYLPFYRLRTAWGSQWFSLADGESLLVLDERGEPAAYALYSKHYDKDGKLSSISLKQCEPAPGREDAESAVRFALSEVFGPLDLPVTRIVDNLSGTSEHAIAALREAGFAPIFEQKLMWLDLG